MHSVCIERKGLVASVPCMASAPERADKRPMQTVILSPGDYKIACGVRLRQLIDALGLKYVEAARHMEIPPNQLGNWMRGDALPTPYQLYRFCRINGVNTDWVYLGDPSGLPGRVTAKLLEAAQPPEAPAAGARRASEKA